MKLRTAMVVFAVPGTVLQHHGINNPLDCAGADEKKP
jgi:hypothetical protein